MVLGHRQGAACILEATQLQGKLKKNNEEPSRLYVEGMQANSSVQLSVLQASPPLPLFLVVFPFLLHSCVIFLHLEAA